MDQSSTTADPAPLLDRARFRALLGVGERRFVELLKAGIIDRPLDLGPRLARWQNADYEQALKRLKRRAPGQEPDHLRGKRKGSTP